MSDIKSRGEMKASLNICIKSSCDEFGPKSIWSPLPHFLSPWTNDPNKLIPLNCLFRGINQLGTNYGGPNVWGPYAFWVRMCLKFSLSFSWYKFWFKHQWSWMASDAVAIQKGIKGKSQDENWWHFWLLPIWSYTFGIHLRLKTQEFSATQKSIMGKVFGLQSVIWHCLYAYFTDFMLL